MINKFRAPKFWYQPSPLNSLLSNLLWPLEKIYASIASYNLKQPPKYKSPIPVLCCGNFTSGGSGKTPTCIALAKAAKKSKLKVGFLTRGYGRLTKNNFLVNKKHTAKQVGDEALLLARHATCVVANNRIDGAKMLEKQKVDLIIMDDGFQNNKLHKTFNLIVLDTDLSIGNGKCLPAGPLRAPLPLQLKYAHAILFIGEKKPNIKIPKRIKKLYGKRTITNPNQFKNKNILAFAAIANCQQFFTSLKKCGANIVATKSFPDHHHFTPQECKKLLAQAKAKKLQLVTTEKDFVKLNKSPKIKVAKMATSGVDFSRIVATFS